MDDIFKVSKSENAVFQSLRMAKEYRERHDNPYTNTKSKAFKEAAFEKGAEVDDGSYHLLFDPASEDEPVPDIRSVWTKKQSANQLNFSGLTDDTEQLYEEKTDRLKLEIEHVYKMAGVCGDSPLEKLEDLRGRVRHSINALDALIANAEALRDDCLEVSKTVEDVLESFQA